MINSKAAGRLLAAGEIYNGNSKGFRQTADQPGGDAPAGYDQVINDQTRGLLIAGASIAVGLTMGRIHVGVDKSAVAARAEAAKKAWQNDGSFTETGPGTQVTADNKVENNANLRIPSKDKLDLVALSPNRNGLTDAGRARQKHCGMEGSVYSYSRQKASVLNQEAQAIVNEILVNLHTKTETIVLFENKKATVVEVTVSDGRAIGFNTDSSKIIGFREAPIK